MNDCCRTFYHANLLQFQGNDQGNIALQHRMTVLPWNGSKFLRKKVLQHWPQEPVLLNNTAVNYHSNSNPTFLG